MRHPRKGNSKRSHWTMDNVRVLAHKKWVRGHKFKARDGRYIHPLPHDIRAKYRAGGLNE